MNALEEISQHRVPCGPMTVAAAGVCRRRLRDSYDQLLDRLTQEIHQEYTPPELPTDHEFDKQGNIVHKDELAKREKAAKTMQKGKEKAKKEREKNEPHSPEVLEAKKEKLLQEGMMKAEVKTKLKEYEEKLMGNSKILQDTSGKLKKR
jgi:hypothetical protein